MSTNDKDINIGITTTADTSGAEKASKSIHQLGDDAKQAQTPQKQAVEIERDFAQELQKTTTAAREKNKELRAMEVQVATARKAEREAAAAAKNLIDDGALVKGAAAAIPGGGPVTGMINNLGPAASGLVVEAGIITGYIAAIAAVPAATQYAIGKLQNLKQVLADSGQGLGKNLQIELDAANATMAPFVKVIDFAKEKWKSFTNFISLGTDAVIEANQKADESLDKLQKKRIEIATDQQTNLQSVYSNELEELKEQERTLGRIQKLRSQMGNIAVQRAQNAVQIAKEDGGDVAFAQARAISVELQTKLSALGDDLAMAKAKAETAQTKYDSAFSSWTNMSDDISVNLEENKSRLAKMKKAGASDEAISKVEAKIKEDQDKLTKLSTNLSDSKKQLDAANQEVTDQSALWAQKKDLLVENTGIELHKLEVEVQNGVSKKAGKELDSIRTILETANQQTASEVQAAVTEVQAKATEQQTNTVAAIKTLAPDPQAQQAVSGAISEVGNKMTEQGNAQIAMLSQISAGLGNLIARQNAQQTQINQLFSRVR